MLRPDANSRFCNGFGPESSESKEKTRGDDCGNDDYDDADPLLDVCEFSLQLRYRTCLVLYRGFGDISDSLGDCSIY